MRGSKTDLEASWHWIDGPGFSLKVIAVMRPCDGMSGLVRKNRRKAVFAFKGLFPKGICHVFSLGQWVFIAVFGSTGKPETSERNPIFTNRTAGHKCKTAVWSTDFGFSPHFRKRLFPACGKLWKPRVQRFFAYKNRR